MSRTSKSSLQFVSATPEHWPQLETLFGRKGACSGCWCMSWRLPRADFFANKGDKNRAAFRRLVMRGTEPGILAMDGDTPVGWCCVSPRQEFVRLQNHRTLKPIDDQPVWSVVCLFVAKGYRRQGVSVELLKAAVEHARYHGAQIVEGYPTDPGGKLPDPFVYTGLVSAFRRAGFTEVARPARTRAIMRYVIGRKPAMPRVSSS